MDEGLYIEKVCFFIIVFIMEEKAFLFDISEFKKVDYINNLAYNKVLVAHDGKTNKDFILDHFYYKPDKKVEIDLNHSIEKLRQNPHPILNEILGCSLQQFDQFESEYIKLISKFHSNITLSSLLRSLRVGKTIEGFDNTTRFTIMAGIARGMMHFYEHEIGFLSLRPYNVFLDENFNPIILPEFNLVTQAGFQNPEFPAARLDENIYVPFFDYEYENNSPEISDVYSFAMIAYEIINGSRAFSSDKTIQSAIGVRKRMDKGGYPVFHKPIPPSLN